MNKHYKALFEGLENELEVEKAKNADLRSEIEELKKKIILLNTQNNITANTTEQESPTDSLMQSKPKTVISFSYRSSEWTTISLGDSFAYLFITERIFFIKIHYSFFSW